MKISACVITKNEEKNIVGYLKSLRQYVDEIILVDTGSADHTISIAEQYQATVYSFAWQDDFSAAKNFALSKAGGDWVVFLDADEYFSPETVKNLPQIIGRYGGECDAFLGKMMNIDTENNNKTMDYFYTVRFFKRLPSLCYEGKIHEQLVKHNGGNLKLKLLTDEELLIYHTGYSANLSEAKAKRNLHMLLIEIERTTTPEKFYVYLAEAYFGLGNHQKAVYYAILDIESGKKELTYASRPYRILIESTKSLAYSVEERRQVIELAMAAFPDLPDFCAEYGLLYYQEGNDEKACVYFRQALRLHEKYQGLEPSILHNSLPLLQKLSQVASGRQTEGKGKEVTEKRSYRYFDHLYQQLKENESGLVYGKCVHEIAKLLQEYVVCILKTEQEAKSGWETGVTEGLRRIVYRYHGVGTALTAEDVDDYRSMLPAIMDTADKALIKKYLGISCDFSRQVRSNLIKELMEDINIECFSGLADDFTEEDFSDDKLCYVLGKYYFQLCDDESAERCFEKAVKLGSDERSIGSYLKWIEERR